MKGIECRLYGTAGKAEDIANCSKQGSVDAVGLGDIHAEQQMTNS
jgi:hypothetical protein